MFFIQLIFIFRDQFASSLDAGSVSALTYGWMIMQVPETLIGTALGTALLPTLAEYATRKDWDAFWRSTQDCIQFLIALTIPAALILSLGLGPLIQLAFGFDDAGTALVMAVTTAYLAGLVAHSLIEVGARTFYSRQNALIPLLTSGVTVAVFLIFGYPFSKMWGAAGIAWATTIAFSVEMVILFILLTRQMNKSLDLMPTLMRLLMGTVVGGLVTLAALQLIPARHWITSILAMGAGFIAAVFFLLKDVKRVFTI
jgi:putative peptidoglycan lipid II flippase